ncbi:MAG: hypothetical protein V8Q54_06405 [Alistipes senegalensis]
MDKLWLLTGEMFADARTRGPDIPFDVDVEHGLKRLEHLEPESNLILSPVGACDLAMCYTGRAMGALVPARDGGAAEGRGPRCDYSGGRIMQLSPEKL